jgi:hypothetical protein
VAIDNDPHARKTHIPGEEFEEETRQAPIPAIAKQMRRPKAADLPASAIVTPPPQRAERYDEDLTTKRTAAANLPTRPFAFLPAAARPSGAPDPAARPAVPEARPPPPKPIAPPLPAAARFATPKPMPSPLPPKPMPSPLPLQPTPTPAPAATAQTDSENRIPTTGSEDRISTSQLAADGRAQRRRQVVFKQSSRPPASNDPTVAETHIPSEPKVMVVPTPPATTPAPVADAAIDLAAPPRASSSRPQGGVAAEAEPGEMLGLVEGPRKNMRVIVIGAVAFSLLVLVIAAVRAALRSPEDVATPAPSGLEPPPPPPAVPQPTQEPTSVARGSTPPSPPAPQPASPPRRAAAPSPPPAAPPSPPPAAAPASGTAAAPDTAATAPPDHDKPGTSRPKVTPRPKGTYDPLGI